MEQRLAVLAGADTEAVIRRGGADVVIRRGGAEAVIRRGGADVVIRRGGADAVIRRGGMHAAPARRGAAWLLAAALVASAGVAEARPKRGAAKAAFDRGLAAYKKGNFTAASEALSKSFELERDADTLFAWAQAERKLEHCDKALDLYDTVLTFELPERNREAVERSIADCRAVIAAQQPPPPPVVEPPPPPVVAPPIVAPPPVAPPRGRAWYRDPVALTLLGTGLVAGGVGAGLLVSARSLNSDSRDANTIDEARRLGDQARSRGNLGLITAGAGGALLIGGIVWIVLSPHADEQPTVTSWVVPGGGGISVRGGF